MTGSGSHLQVIEPEAKLSLAERDDDPLMVLLAAGHRAAFDVLLARHEARVFGIAAKYLGDRALAEEAVQETFVRLWRSRESYVPSGRFTAYLGGIALNACRELSRSRRRRAEAMRRFSQSVERESWAAEAEAELLQREAEVRAERLVAALPRRHKEAVVLRFYAEMSYAEMSQLLGRNEVTLRSRVFQALKRLREAATEGEP